MKSFAPFITAALAAIAAAAPNKATTTSKAELPSYPAVSSNTGCITTSTQTGPFRHCVFNPISTKYLSTVTLRESVNCNGCTGIDIKTVPEIHCPIEIFTATAVDSKPTTTVETVCKVTPTK